MNHFERSVKAPRTFADEYIELWAAVYAAQGVRMRDYQIGFETFLLAPSEIIAALDAPPVPVPRLALLPRQRAAQARIDRDAALDETTERAIATLGKEAHCADGAWVGKMKHNRLPNKPKYFRALFEVNGS